jgi:protein-disulfide isomerase
MPVKKEVEKNDEKKNYVMYVLIGLLVVGAFALGNLYTKVKMLEKGTSGQAAVPTAGAAAPQVAQATTTPGKPVDIKIADNDPQLGSKDAKVTVVIFEDFQCPFCGAFAGLDEKMIKNMQAQDATWQPALSNIKKDYVDTGKVRLVWKDYPFLGDESKWSAIAARCAQDQGKFWEYHDYLFSHQNGENQGSFSKDNLKKFAATLGLNTQTFNNCVDSNKYDAKPAEWVAFGQSVGVSGTPGTFVNGTLISGAAPYSTFKSAIDAALK